MRLISQGTKSILIGCHSPAHSVMVTIAWRKLYGKWPKPWELACIFLHDIGHVGTNYMDDINAKHDHWRMGAKIAGVLFGNKGYKLCAGHAPQSGIERSRLYRPDKYARLISPTWLLVLDRTIEPEIGKVQGGSLAGIQAFREKLKKSLDSGEFVDTHEIFLEMKREQEAREAK